jgi:hypothetical protein
VIPALLVALIVLGAAGGAGAVSFTLDDTTRRAAVREGERSTMADSFDREWQVSGPGGTSLTVLTPFHRLALAARHAAFKQKPLKPADIDRVLREDAQRLIVWVRLSGSHEDFARHYTPTLIDGTREIKASSVQNERTAPRQEDGSYLALCRYGFPTRDLDPRARVVLAVADADGRDVSRFTIDLASMR